MIIEDMNNVKVSEAVCLCLLDDLRAEFQDDAIFTVHITGGQIAGNPYLKVALKRRNYSWSATYQLAVECDFVILAYDHNNYSYTISCERFDAHDPSLSNISTKIRFLILRDAMRNAYIPPNHSQ